MAELIVKDINSDWSISFDFSNAATTCYDFKSMTVGKLKKEIFNANNLYAIEKQTIIFMGIILNQDDVELRNLVRIALNNCNEIPLTCYSLFY